MDNRIVAQIMGENESIPRNEAQHGIHPAAIDTHAIAANWSPEAYCIGEKIMSLRQLIKRFGYFFQISNGSPTTTNTIIAPFSITNPVTAVGGTKTISMYEYYYFIYAFWRGSMRIKAVSSNNGTTSGSAGTGFQGNWIVNMYNSVQDTFNFLVSRFTVGQPIQTANIASSGTLNMGASAQLIRPMLEGAAEFEVPYYNVSHISPCTTYDPVTELPITVANVLKGHIPPVIVQMVPAFRADATGGAQGIVSDFYRAPGDDFSFMYLVGVPPLVNVSRS